MSTIATFAVDTIQAFTAQIEAARNSTASILWFRGHGRESYSLTPTLYRHPDLSTAQEYLELERKMLNRFRQRSIPYQTRTLSNDWDFLFVMQHYGVPTRLLDWTENPFIALFFALEHGLRFRNSLVEDACVWILNSEFWNQHALKHMSFDGSTLAYTDEEVRGYAPSSESGQANRLSLMNVYPVALYGAHNSPRIVAQRGAFTIFGKDTRPMELINEDDGFPDGALSKIVIRKEAIVDILKSMTAIGYTSSTVYPDLYGLSEEIKWSFGFLGA